MQNVNLSVEQLLAWYGEAQVQIRVLEAQLQALTAELEKAREAPAPEKQAE